jgi:hypothetical protein
MLVFIYIISFIIILYLILQISIKYSEETKQHLKLCAVNSTVSAIRVQFRR